MNFCNSLVGAVRTICCPSPMVDCGAWPASTMCFSQVSSIRATYKSSPSMRILANMWPATPTSGSDLEATSTNSDSFRRSRWTLYFDTSNGSPVCTAATSYPSPDFLICQISPSFSDQVPSSGRSETRSCVVYSGWIATVGAQPVIAAAPASTAPHSVNRILKLLSLRDSDIEGRKLQLGSTLLVGQVGNLQADC